MYFYIFPFAVLHPSTFDPSAHLCFDNRRQYLSALSSGHRALSLNSTTALQKGALQLISKALSMAEEDEKAKQKSPGSNEAFVCTSGAHSALGSKGTTSLDKNIELWEHPSRLLLLWPIPLADLEDWRELRQYVSPATVAAVKSLVAEGQEGEGVEVPIPPQLFKASSSTLSPKALQPEQRTKNLRLKFFSAFQENLKQRLQRMILFQQQQLAGAAGIVNIDAEVTIDLLEARLRVDKSVAGLGSDFSYMPPNTGIELPRGDALPRGEERDSNTKPLGAGGERDAQTSRLQVVTHWTALYVLDSDFSGGDPDFSAADPRYVPSL